MKQRRLQDWIQWLEQQRPSAGYDHRAQYANVADILNLTPPACPLVTVAGTNGKGSCVRILSEVMSQAGYRVGSYYSPHVIDFNERIQLNGQPVSDGQLCHSFRLIEQAMGDNALTYYSIVTLAALLLFQQEALDLIVLEVGLGGRLDATNLFPCDIAVITNVSLDHQEYLGETREKIAKEKAGIIHQGRQVIYGERDIPEAVLQRVTEQQATLYQWGQDFTVQQQGQAWALGFGQLNITDLPLSTLPINSAACAVVATSLLRDELPIKREQLQQGLINARMLGRFQHIIHRGIEIICDGAHNPAACEWLGAQMQTLPKDGRIIALWGMMMDKDMAACVRAIAGQIDEWHVGRASAPRSADSGHLTAALQAANVQNYVTYNSIAKGLQGALQAAKAGDKLLVFGSFYVVAEALHAISVGET